MFQKRRRRNTLPVVKELREFKKNPSKYHFRFDKPRGVRETKQGRYAVQIRLAGSTIHIGTYDTIIEAMLAYDKYIRIHKLEKATNFLVEL
jgi:hypothetical protein